MISPDPQKLITDDELNHELYNLTRFLSDVVAEQKPTKIDPTLFVLSEPVGTDAEDRRVFVPALIPIMDERYNDNSTRHAVIADIGSAVAQQGMLAHTVFVVAEMWVKAFSADTDVSTIGKITDYDDKQEVVLVAGCTLDGRTNYAMLSIKRGDDNSISIETPSISRYNPDQPESFYANMLRAFWMGYSRSFLAAKL